MITKILVQSVYRDWLVQCVRLWLLGLSLIRQAELGRDTVSCLPVMYDYKTAL
jgi:hypothetical protein